MAEIFPYTTPSYSSKQLNIKVITREAIKLRLFLTNLKRAFIPDVHPMLPITLKIFQIFGITERQSVKVTGAAQSDSLRSRRAGDLYFQRYGRAPPAVRR